MRSLETWASLLNKNFIVITLNILYQGLFVIAEQQTNYIAITPLENNWSNSYKFISKIV